MSYLPTLLFDAGEQSNLFSPDQFAGYAVTAVITIFNILLVFIIFRLFFYKKVIKMINDRQAALDAELEAARQSREEAQKIVDSSKETIDDAKRKGSEIMEEAKANAEKQSKAVIDQANNEAQQIIERAEEDAERMKRNAFETMKDDIADLSVQIAGHIIGDAVSKEELKKSAAKHTEEILDKEVEKSE
ncbi:F0F1 ATP synthase subunit B [Butyrivibrio sp. AE2032]|uniref:F0F1 ATP synthase subunit B n=1 Tax=Butyrivibrio sp. AE2032 TaxID=1458463 RepID=UPI00054D06E9|nr:F0F1 ATP synthase subunit B [Butyrivibrio sp. AE2032]